MQDEIRRLVGIEHHATAEARLKMKDIDARIARLDARRAHQPPSPASRPAAPKAGAPAVPSVEDIARALDAMSPDERAHVLARAALKIPKAIKGVTG